MGERRLGEADSLVINPHKMLFVPFDFSALYVRDIERLRRVFTLVPSICTRDPAGAEINYMDYGVQLGRRFRALKAWMVWRTFGRTGIAARIRDHLRLAQLFAAWIEDDARFEISAPVMMGVVCFRLKAPMTQSRDRKNSEDGREDQRGRRSLSDADETARPRRDASRVGKSAHDRRASSPRLGNHSRSGLDDRVKPVSNARNGIPRVPADRRRAHRLRCRLKAVRSGLTYVAVRKL